MYRYGLFLFAVASMLSSCSKKQDLDGINSPYNRLKAAIARGTSEAPDQRADGAGNPFNRYGRLHNEGFRDAVLNTNTSGTLKQWVISMGEYTGSSGLSDFNRTTRLSTLDLDSQIDSARAAGADEVALATYRLLAEELQAMETPDFEALTTFIDGAESAIMEFDPDESGTTHELALGVTSVCRYSFALHTGQNFDGVDYGAQSWNPTPNLPPHPETGIEIDWIRLILADVLGFLESFEWKEGLKFSIHDLMDQLSEGGFVLESVFHPALEATVPFAPVSGSGFLPDN